jgi:hypothetical protein
VWDDGCGGGSFREFLQKDKITHVRPVLAERISLFCVRNNALADSKLPSEGCQDCPQPTIVREFRRGRLFNRRANHALSQSMHPCSTAAPLGSSFKSEGSLLYTQTVMIPW